MWWREADRRRRMNEAEPAATLLIAAFYTISICVFVRITEYSKLAGLLSTMGLLLFFHHKGHETQNPVTQLKRKVLHQNRQKKVAQASIQIQRGLTLFSQELREELKNELVSIEDWVIERYR